MPWFIAITLLGVAVVGGLGLVVHVHQRRFAARVARETRALLALPPSLHPRPTPSELPAVVERYRQLAVGDRAAVRTLRLRHGGTFRMTPTSQPRPIRGVQLFTVDPPGFVWWGRVRIAPGVWVDARDMLAAGAGTMRVLVDDVVQLADARGPQLDQGSALRLLAELVWVPTALFDARTVTWAAIDASHARATLQLGALIVSGVFAFGTDGLPASFTAERFTDKGALTPWGGVYRDWRTVAGLRVPFEAEVSWLLPAPYSYAHWRVDAMAYDLEASDEPIDLGPRAIAAA